MTKENNFFHWTGSRIPKYRHPSWNHTFDVHSHAHKQAQAHRHFGKASPQVTPLWTQSLLLVSKTHLPSLGPNALFLSQDGRRNKNLPQERREDSLCTIVPYLARPRGVSPVPATQLCKTQAPAIPHFHRVPDSLTPRSKERPQALSHPQQNICNTLKTDGACTASHSADVQKEVLQMKFHTFV